MSTTALFLTMASLCCLTVELAAKPSCGSGSSVQWIADPDDCSKFYMCHGSQMFDFNCGDNVWDPDTKTCVGKGSQWDKCSIVSQLDALDGITNIINDNGHPCANDNRAVFAKADHCAQYHDCSRSGEPTIGSDPTVVECKFPLLFNAESKRCEHYEMVKCGSRKEPLDACEYKANQCQRAHCIPCSVRYPSCRGLPDGLNPWVGREYSPFFVLCQQQRSLYHGRCDESKGTQLFDPIKRVCYEMKQN